MKKVTKKILKPIGPKQDRKKCGWKKITVTTINTKAEGIHVDRKKIKVVGGGVQT